VKVIEGIKLWHRILTSGSEKSMINVDIDWITFLEDAFQQAIILNTATLQTFHLQDPFLNRIDSSPSKHLPASFLERREEVLLSLHLCFSYLLEKIMYDLRSSSKKMALPFLLQSYVRLFRNTLFPNIPLLLHFRPVCFQIISVALSLLLCQDDTHSVISHQLRLDILDGLRQIFEVDSRYRIVNKRHAALEESVKCETLRMLIADLDRIQAALHPKATYPSSFHFYQAGNTALVKAECDRTKHISILSYIF